MVKREVLKLNKIVIQKYGGSSVADSEGILNVAQRVAKKIKNGYKVIVVISAMGKTTDNLIKLAKQVSSIPDARELDMLLSTGEQVSAALLSMALRGLHVDSKSLNAFQAGIITTESFNEARIKHFDRKKILGLLGKHNALVVTGFQGVTEEGELTTLGRGGSDLSAVALAAALDVPCEIYSDVAGIYTTDPKLYPKAKKLKYVSYDEMLELSAAGAKVLHGRSVEVAKRFNIPIYCGSSFSEEEGSYVMHEDLIIERAVVTGLTAMDNQTQVVLKNLPMDYALVRNVFAKAGEAGLNVDMISIINNENDLAVSFTIIDDKKKQVQQSIKKLLKGISNSTVEYHSGYVKLTVVGIGMKTETGVASDFFSALKNVPLRLVTTSEIKISCLIEPAHKQDAINSLCKKFKL